MYHIKHYLVGGISKQPSKTKNMKNKTLKTLFALCLLMAFIPSSFAQYIAATFPDITAATASEPVTVNCDHSEFVIGTNVYNYSAIVWDNYPSTGNNTSTVFVNFRGFTAGGNVTTSVPIAMAKNPDVIIGNNSSGDFFLGVVYELSGRVKLNVYLITPTTNISGTATGVSLSLLSNTALTPGTLTCTNPHIDGWADGSGTTSMGCFPLTKYAISWQENAGSGAKMNGGTALFANPSVISLTPISFFAGATQVYNSDISVYTDGSGNQIANFIFTRDNGSGSTELDVESGDVATTSSILTTLESAADLRSPRIESQSWNPGASSNVTWMAICPKKNTSTLKYEPLEYDSKGGTAFNVMSGFANDYEAVGISAGTNLLPSGTLNSGSAMWVNNYGMIMYPFGTAKLKFGMVGNAGGNSSLGATAYGPNKTNQVAPFTGFPVSTSTSSNSGRNMLVAWSTHTTVAYKLIYDTISTFHFKPDPTGVANVNKDEIAVYPNPTTNNILVNGITGASFIIYDATGKNVGSGNVITGQTIYTDYLSVGTYYIELTANNTVRKLPFVKQ